MPDSSQTEHEPPTTSTGSSGAAVSAAPEPRIAMQGEELPHRKIKHGDTSARPKAKLAGR